MGRRPDCKECCKKLSSKRNKIRNAKFPEKRKDAVLKTKYGISLEQYNHLLKVQWNACKICGSTAPSGGVFSVDHCHKTGKVRGLLCHLCNIGLGAFKDSTETLKKAISYLETNSG